MQNPSEIADMKAISDVLASEARMQMDSPVTKKKRANKNKRMSTEVEGAEVEKHQGKKTKNKHETESADDAALFGTTRRQVGGKTTLENPADKVLKGANFCDAVGALIGAVSGDKENALIFAKSFCSFETDKLSKITAMLVQLSSCRAAQKCAPTGKAIDMRICGSADVLDALGLAKTGKQLVCAADQVCDVIIKKESKMVNINGNVATFRGYDDVKFDMNSRKFSENMKLDDVTNFLASVLKSEVKIMPVNARMMCIRAFLHHCTVKINAKKYEIKINTVRKNNRLIGNKPYDDFVHFVTKMTESPCTYMEGSTIDAIIGVLWTYETEWGTLHNELSVPYAGAVRKVVEHLRNTKKVAKYLSTVEVEDSTYAKLNGESDKFKSYRDFDLEPDYGLPIGAFSKSAQKKLGLKYMGMDLALTAAKLDGIDSITSLEELYKVDNLYVEASIFGAEMLKITAGLNACWECANDSLFVRMQVNTGYLGKDTKLRLDFNECLAIDLDYRMIQFHDDYVILCFRKNRDLQNEDVVIVDPRHQGRVVQGELRRAAMIRYHANVAYDALVKSGRWVNLFKFTEDFKFVGAKSLAIVRDDVSVDDIDFMVKRTKK